MEKKELERNRENQSKNENENELESDDKNENSDHDDLSIVEELVNYLNSSEYNERIQLFFKANCSNFSDYHERQQNGSGNQHEWINIYNEYIELVENELQLFCTQHDIDINSIFLLIQKYISTYGEVEFIPMFLKTTDENYFFEQMYSYAIESTLIQNVNEISTNEGKGEESMTGIWQTDPDRFDETELSNWLVTLGIPWVFRKLVLRSQRSSSKVMIAHIPNQQFEISTILPIFGSWTILVTLNGKWQSGSNRLGDPIRVSGREKSDGVHIHLKNTKSGNLTVFKISYQDEYLLLYRELFISGDENNNPDAILHTYLLR